MVDFSVDLPLAVLLLDRAIVDSHKTNPQNFPLPAASFVNWPEVPAWYEDVIHAETTVAATHVLNQVEKRLLAQLAVQSSIEQIKELAVVQSIRPMLRQPRRPLGPGLEAFLRLGEKDSTAKVAAVSMPGASRKIRKGDDPLCVQMWEVCKGLSPIDRSANNVWSKLVESAGEKGAAVLREDGRCLVWRYDGVTEKRISKRGFQSKLRRLLSRRSG